MIDYDELILGWMDRYVRDSGGKAQDEKPVRYFVMGANEWREADAWPPPAARPTAMFLSSPATAGAKPGGLRKTKPGPADSFSEFVSDPANPVVDAFPPYTGGHDYSALASRSDVLVFDSAPLERDTEVTGPISAIIHLSTDAPDTDLWVRLLDVSPEGKAINLMSPGLDVIRASYRHETPYQRLLRPGRVYALELKNLMTSNLFRKGHRIRVQISATFFPNFSRNLHTGKLETHSAEMRKATIRIHHNPRHPSLIVLPVVPRPPNRARRHAYPDALLEPRVKKIAPAAAEITGRAPTR